MEQDNTKVFFDWLDSQDLKPKDVADKLGNNHLTISNWRSKGIPKGKRYACQSLMDKAKQSVAPVETPLQNMVLEFEDSALFDRLCEKSVRDGFDKPREYVTELLNHIVDEDLQLLASSITSMVMEGGMSYELPCAAVAAGHPISGDALDKVTLTRAYGSRYLAFLVCGPSMEPEIEDGAVIVGLKFEHFRVHEPKKGLVYVFSLDGELTLKRYNTRPATAEEIQNAEEYVYTSPKDGTPKVKVLQSANPDYPEIIVKGNVEIVAWYDAGNQP